MEKKNNTTTYLIVGLIIGLVFGGLAGYFISVHFHKAGLPQRGNFQIDDATKAQITSFFDGNPTSDQINSYCQQNRMNCAYYCRTINPGNEACKTLINSTFSRGGP